MNPILKSLGINNAFVAGKADLSGINGAKNLNIDQVILDLFVKN
jgi:hypothetical protein